MADIRKDSSLFRLRPASSNCETDYSELYNIVTLIIL